MISSWKHKIAIVLLFLLLAVNALLLFRKTKRSERYRETISQFFYEKIPLDEGCDEFYDAIKVAYPNIDHSKTEFIIYRWDSLNYEFVHKEEMKVLDSLAAVKKDRISTVFITEMDHSSTLHFLQRNQAVYSHVKIMCNLDNFISAVYYFKSRTIEKDHDSRRLKRTAKSNNIHNIKSPSLYFILDSKGKIQFMNNGYFRILKDTLFMRRVKNPNEIQS